MSDGPKKAADTLNTYGIVIIGVVATLMIWALVVLLQAYYGHSEIHLSEAREVDGQDSQQRSMKAQQQAELRGGQRNAKTGTGTIAIERAMEVVTGEAQRAAPSLVPAMGSHDRPTVPAVWGRPQDGVVPQPGDQEPVPIDRAQLHEGAAPGMAPPVVSPAPPPANNAPPAANPAAGKPPAADVNP